MLAAAHNRSCIWQLATQPELQLLAGVQPLNPIMHHVGLLGAPKAFAKLSGPCALHDLEWQARAVASGDELHSGSFGALDAILHWNGLLKPTTSAQNDTEAERPLLGWLWRRFLPPTAAVPLSKLDFGALSAQGARVRNRLRRNGSIWTRRNAVLKQKRSSTGPKRTSGGKRGGKSGGKGRGGRGWVGARPGKRGGGGWASGRGKGGGRWAWLPTVPWVPGGGAGGKSRGRAARGKGKGRGARGGRGRGRARGSGSAPGDSGSSSSNSTN